MKNKLKIPDNEQIAIKGKTSMLNVAENCSSNIETFLDRK